jgi:hypothetical protein
MDLKMLRYLLTQSIAFGRREYQQDNDEDDGKQLQLS